MVENPMAALADVERPPAAAGQQTEAEDGTKSGVNGIDFGAFKVVDAQESALTLVNRGKYEVGFKFVMRRKLMREILSFEPSEGTLEPGGTELKVEVKLTTEGALDLVANTDVRIQFTEILTGEMMNDLTMPLKLWAHAVYSKYAVVPRGISQTKCTSGWSASAQNGTSCHGRTSLSPYE